MADKSIGNDNIRISANVPGLNSHIKINVNDPSEKVYWYIKFNIPLDKKFVSKDTTNVTDTDGYIMRTYIFYDEMENHIVVSPIDSYEQDRYYLLNISKAVRSANGQQLKREIHILFKLFDNRISSFKILDAAAKVPVPKVRPSDYDELQILKKEAAERKKSERISERTPPKTKVYSFEREEGQVTSETPLKYAEINIKIIPSLIGLGVILASLFTGVAMIIIAAIVGCFVGIGITISGFLTKEARSNIHYNRGVGSFKHEKYEKAQEHFKKALAINDNNELAESALDKVNFYIR